MSHALHLPHLHLAENFGMAFRAVGGWRSAIVGTVSIAAGALFMGALVYPLAHDNEKRIAATEVVDHRILDSLGVISRRANRRADWNEVQICAIGPHTKRGNGFPDALNAQLRARCDAAARRLADNP